MSVKIKVPTTEQLEERQRVEDERAFFADATEVAYLPAEDVLVLRMQSGVAVQIPRRFVDEIADAAKVILQQELTLGVGGDVISVRSLDVDISIAGLLRDVFGFNIQKMGGRAKSEAKTHAARVNGAKGGRPKVRGSDEQSVDVPVGHRGYPIQRAGRTGGIGDEQTITVPLSREQIDVRKRVDIGKPIVVDVEGKSGKRETSKKVTGKTVLGGLAGFFGEDYDEDVDVERVISLEPERPSKA